MPGDSVRRDCGQVLDRRHGSVQWAGERELELEQVLERALVRVQHDAEGPRHMDRRVRAGRA